jgi:hypothetical protein
MESLLAYCGPGDFLSLDAGEPTGGDRGAKGALRTFRAEIEIGRAEERIG